MGDVPNFSNTSACVVIVIHVSFINTWNWVLVITKDKEKERGIHEWIFWKEREKWREEIK